MADRPNLGFNDEDEPAAPAPSGLDLSEFQPRAVRRPDQQTVAQSAAKANFRSREARDIPAAEIPAPPVARATRRRRTGRSSQLNLKVRQDTIDAFYALADAKGWVLGEAFEIAVGLLKDKYGPAAAE